MRAAKWDSHTVDKIARAPRRRLVLNGFGEPGGCFDPVLGDGVTQELSRLCMEEHLLYFAYRPFLQRRARTLRRCCRCSALVLE